ncbi:MAG: [FeFe] hydrogenase H-cluster radical SAM maturase HydE [Desulfovibrio sp.]|nr:[FeFe] hydrogenase H-cluster radical SAM maturase HydE [Desulfovibrio sp.]
MIAFPSLNAAADLVEKLERERMLSRGEFKSLLAGRTLPGLTARLFERARAARRAVYGDAVYLRGLIEFTNYCRKDCFYCGIRKSNARAERYRLSREQILACCAQGRALGFRTFVLQGGEDPYFNDRRLADIIGAVRAAHPDCALTLSLGERSRASYQTLFDAGADRYLLRHESAAPGHYRSLHPAGHSLRNRMRCLSDLRDIGYQVGCGFMVGSPGQTDDCLIDDLFFIKDLQPQMVGIGPFIPHKDTPFAGEQPGGAPLTVFLLGILRLMDPALLLPATTALGTIHPQGREAGLRAGANVLMPNLSPVAVRKKYMLYDDKICTGDEAAECRACLERRVNAVGLAVVVSRGDCAGFLRAAPASACSPASEPAPIPGPVVRRQDQFFSVPIPAFNPIPELSPAFEPIPAFVPAPISESPLTAKITELPHA